MRQLTIFALTLFFTLIVSSEIFAQKIQVTAPHLTDYKDQVLEFTYPKNWKIINDSSASQYRIYSLPDNPKNKTFLIIEGFEKKSDINLVDYASYVLNYFSTQVLTINSNTDSSEINIIDSRFRPVKRSIMDKLRDGLIIKSKFKISGKSNTFECRIYKIENNRMSIFITSISSNNDSKASHTFETIFMTFSII